MTANWESGTHNSKLGLVNNMEQGQVWERELQDRKTKCGTGHVFVVWWDNVVGHGAVLSGDRCDYIVQRQTHWIFHCFPKNIIKKH